MNDLLAGPASAAVGTHEEKQNGRQQLTTRKEPDSDADRPTGYTGATSSDGATAGSPFTATVAPLASGKFSGADGFSLSRLAPSEVSHEIAIRAVRAAHEPADPAAIRFKPTTALGAALDRSTGLPAAVRLLSDGARGASRRTRTADRNAQPCRASHSLAVEYPRIRIDDRFRVHRFTGSGIDIIGNPSKRAEHKEHRRVVANNCTVENDDRLTFAAGTQARYGPACRHGRR